MSAIGRMCLYHSLFMSCTSLCRCTCTLHHAPCTMHHAPCTMHLRYVLYDAPEQTLAVFLYHHLYHSTSIHMFRTFRTTPIIIPLSMPVTSPNAPHSLSPYTTSLYPVNLYLEILLYFSTKIESFNINRQKRHAYTAVIRHYCILTIDKWSS
ncbi:MAG: hypothetical protein JOS17DRAFT_781479 [Linnemannia elongata]|nr:MAG: hypothetical protein JOS17DRAFT_781479 [Linnemannia elongata]